MAAGDTEPQRWVVPPQHANQRWDHVLAHLQPGLSRREQRHLFASGLVRSQGQVLKKGETAHAGQELEVWPLPSAAQPTPLPALVIVAQSKQWLLLDKPAGVASASGRDATLPSLAAALLERFPAMRGIGYKPDDAGLLSRLDTQTSGLLLAACDAAAFAALRAGAKSDLLHKYYQALVAPGAQVRCGSIELPLGPDRRHNRRVTSGAHVRGRAVPARTEIVRVEHLARATCVTLRVNTAYRHQVRYHLAQAGYPLLNDTLYGGLPHPELKRHALHAQRVVWKGDALIPAFDVSLTLADDLARLLD